MNFSKEQRLLGWALLVVCLISVPISLLSKTKNPKENEPVKSSKKWSSLLLNRNHILVLRLNGMIFTDDGESSSFLTNNSPTGFVIEQLNKAAENPKVKGVLLRINSPGGTVAASQELYAAVRAVRDKGKPVVASLADVAASGGYYLASGCDKIVANSGTLTGSIGVIMHLLNLQEIEKKIGVQPFVVKSGIFKDIGSADRPVTPEEKTILQDIIMDSYDQFVSAVAEGRRLPKDEVKKIADGRIYSGRQAYKVKLVDQLGTYEDSLKLVQKMAKEKYHLSEDLEVHEARNSSFFSLLLDGQAAFGGHPLSIQQLLPVSLQGRFSNQPLWLMPLN